VVEDAGKVKMVVVAEVANPPEVAEDVVVAKEEEEKVMMKA